MKGNRITLLLFYLLGMMRVSCSEGDGLTNETDLQHYDILFCIGRSGAMRMASEVVQVEGQTFRGFEGLLAIPYKTSNADAVTATDVPLISNATGGEADKVNERDYYYITDCSLMQGTNRMLVYGQAKPVSGKEALDQNGKLVTTLINQTGWKDRMLTQDIAFSLQPIRETTAVHPQAQALANYLTRIANTTGWSTAADMALKGLYLDFIHADGDGGGLMAGAADNVRAYVKVLSDQLTGEDALSTAIKANINNKTVTIGETDYNIDNITYPGSIGLPDGAAVIRWTGSSFSVSTEATTLDNINGINRYTYPAELWYYVNSAIRTSSEEVAKSTYEDEDTWSELLADHYQGSRSVISGTKAVAVEDPLQYGVGRLKMILNPITGPLKDAKDITVDYNNDATKLPMKGVIIGGQHTVGFDFQPKGVQSDVDGRFIYDPVVGTADGTTGKWTVNTLVLQSYDEEKVPVILEFENKTGQEFTGKDGKIYPNTKFYLIGMLNPADKGTGAYANRVFTQDYTTEVTMTVTSLALAYSCMPDLLQPRLEIGVQVTMKWEESTPTTVKL